MVRDNKLSFLHVVFEIFNIWARGRVLGWRREGGGSRREGGGSRRESKGRRRESGEGY